MRRCSPGARCWCGKTNPIPIECVARGYLSVQAGRTTARLAPCAASRCRADCANPIRCPAPIFTPATKATSGHDVNISEAEAGRIVGDQLVATLREVDAGALRVRRAHAESRGIILADTKFEFRSHATTGARDAHRRSHDARLLTLLAEGPVPSLAARSQASTSECTRLPRADHMEQAAAGARRCQTRW